MHVMRIGMMARQIRHRLFDLMGLDRMSGSFRILTLNYVYLMVYYTLESVFVNTLLYRMSSNMMDVIHYRAVAYAFIGVSMVVAGYLTKRFSPLTVIKLGGFAYIIMYLILLLGMEHLDQLKYVVAVFSGCGVGLYWCGHNVLLTHYTERSTRGAGVGILGLVQGAMTLLVPVVSGLVISVMHETTGYRIMFAIGMLAVLLQRGLQNKLPQVEMKKRGSDYRLALKLVWHKATVKLMLLSEYVRGIRDGTFVFFLNMLLFEIVTNEFMVGINTFFTGALAIFGSWAYARFSVPSKRVLYALLATTVLLVTNAALALVCNAFTVVVFSSTNAFFNLFLVYCVNTYSYDVMGQNETTRRCLAELSAIREVSLSLGKLTGLFIITLFQNNVKGYIAAMCTLTLTQYLTVLLVKLIRNTMDRKQLRRMSAPA